MLLASEPNRSRAETVDGLRRLLKRLEAVSSEIRAFPFGHPELDRHLPRGGLTAGALHEVTPVAKGDLPVAFGFATALLCRLAKNGPVLFVTSPRGLADFGRPYGHGINGFGLDPVRVMLVEAGDELQALWAMEEGLHSNVPAAVVGTIGAGLDLKTSRRLHVAAGKSGIPLILLCPSSAAGSSAAATRWRIGAAEAARDRFGLITRWRWRVRLERCRNGRLGEWLVEWDHAAYRFSLAAPMADPSFLSSPGTELLARAGAGQS